MRSKNWSREELILAFNLYCKTPFGKMHNHNPDVVNLANLIGRTPSAVSWKLANFARLDPDLQERNISGAEHGSKLDIEVWNEFNEDWERLSFESERLLAQKYKREVEDFLDENENPLPEGKERETTVKTRVNQSFFRKAVLAAYDFQCCITGLSLPELLNASHIIPWSVNIEQRVNPRNGLCLNAIHDRAFDRGLITITSDFRVKLSSIILENESDVAIQNFLLRYENIEIRLPTKFKPEIDFLNYHNQQVFIK